MTKSNLEGEEEGDPGPTPSRTPFFDVGHCKTCFAPGSIFNNYNGDIWRGQIVHNYYVDDNTTITSRVYAQEHRRDRYQIVRSRTIRPTPRSRAWRRASAGRRRPD